MLTPINENFSVSPQLAINDLQEIAHLGFKTVVCNRPDGEGGPEQPTSEAMAAAAKALGITFVYFPVVSGAPLDLERAEDFAEQIEECPIPAVFYCRSGMRSSNLLRVSGLV